MATWLTALLSLIGALAGIAAKAATDKGATHAQILADVDAAVATFRTALQALDAGVQSAQAATDQAVADAQQRLGGTLPPDEGV